MKHFLKKFQFLKKIYFLLQHGKGKLRRSINKNAISANSFAKNFKKSRDEFYSNPNLMINFMKNHSIYDLWNFYLHSDKGPHYRLPWGETFMTKLPMDVWIYKSLIVKSKPNLIIEIGTQRGTSAILLNELSQEFNTKVITFDILKPKSDILLKFKKLNISFFQTDCTTEKIINDVLSVGIVENEIRALVIDDGSHDKKDVLKTFNLLKTFIKSQFFYVIEDGFSNELLGAKNFLAMNAVREILKSDKSFVNYKEFDDFLFSSAFMAILQRQ